MSLFKKIIRTILSFFNLRITKIRTTNKTSTIEKIFFPKLSNSAFFVESKSSIGWVFGVINSYQSLAYRIDKNFNWKNYDLVLDIGAHVGVISKTANLYGCKVIAIEPDINNFELLKKNFTDNDDVILIHGAIVPKNYENKVHFNIGTTSSAGSIIRSEPFQQRTLGKKVQVPSIKIDDLISKLNHDKILIKFDIEGSEWLIMDELKDLFKSKNIKSIFGELHKIKEGQDYLEVKKFLENLGFKTIFEGNWERSGTIEFYAFR
jgi:FkbM family methyltransferase